jgi:phosphatidylglycerophosphatase C
MLLGYLLKWVPNDVAKVRMLTHFLGGRSRAELAEAARSFADRADGWLRPEGLARLRWHLEQGHDVLLVSASLDLWLTPWAERHGVRLVCTEGAFDEADCFTGHLSTPNCHGQAKVDRVRQVVRLDDYDVVHAYGDSSGDTEMLAVAQHAHFRPFRGAATG